MNRPVNVDIRNGIAQVEMAEKEYRNTFAPHLINALKAVFEDLNRDSSVKVVVLHGYDSYFLCGGTKKELMDLHEGAISKEKGPEFADLNFHGLLLDCQVPVISAMQGHALGGGLALGLFADIVIMGQQCLYSANFMKYGFTPGMGATYIVPYKLGRLLGTEMLLSARNYFGKELKERGCPAHVVDKKEVIPSALKVAEELAAKPLGALKLLKRNLSGEVRDALPKVIDEELAMHRISFAQDEVRDRIENFFGQ